MFDLFGDENTTDLPFELPDDPAFSVIYDEKNNGFRIKVPNGELFYAEHYFDEQLSNRCVEYFLENDSNTAITDNWHEYSKEALLTVPFKNIQWQHDKLNMYGKTVYLPRYSAWYGDNDKPYTYSGLTLQPKPWNKGLLYIKEKIEAVTPEIFNSVLMNWYRDGDDYINWHTDAESELGKNPTIASANFGETRDFILKHNDTGIKIKIPLKHGSLLVMSGALQHHWQHSVPKRKKVKGARFNLTFRTIKKS